MSETRRELFHLSCGQSPLRATADWRIFLPMYTVRVTIPTYPRRQAKDRRLVRPPKMWLMPRDIQALKAIYEYRAISHRQLLDLVFGKNHPSIGTKRLYALYHNGYVERMFLPARGGVAVSPTVYLLAEKGARELSLRGDYADFYWSKDHLRIGSLFLQHTLSISEVRVQLTLACQDAGVSLVEWRGERELKHSYDTVSISTAAGGTRQQPIIPDGYFVLNTLTGKRHFMLELDRGTMEGKRFRAKVEGYQAYLDSGLYTQRFGTKSLRILTVTESDRRLKNLKAITERAGGKSRFWFTTLDALASAHILSSPIWHVAQRQHLQGLLH